jgi:energy-coupling factor transporter ATP-binding protein EcfA2
MSGANGRRTNGAPREEPVVGYVQRVEIENIRSIASLVWEVTPGPGWNVVLGDNGAGKSTFLRAMASASFSAKERFSLRTDFEAWVRYRQPEGRIRVGMKTVHGTAEHSFTIRREAGPTETSQDEVALLCFSAGFGPFRRFTGGDPDHEQEVAGLPRVARHMSLFSERFSLRESLAWLKLLRFKELEVDAASITVLRSLRSFVNQPGFLPGGARLDRITSDHVLFVDGNGAEVPVEELSDGYRSILSLTFELIRQLAAHYGADHVFDAAAAAVVAAGIVLIDEVDAHLHPSWQRLVGLFLRKCFPNIQFIVTTHSPLVCQAADVGTVFRLPRLGSDEEGRMVRGGELDRLLYGDPTDAYDTEAMGGIGRSDKAQRMLDALARLNRKEIDAGLDGAEDANSAA